MVKKPIVKKITRISPVWIVPIVAVVIAVWLAVEARLEKGTEIQIEFASASDIIPGQTQIRLKDVQVGSVKSLRLSKDLKSVVVRANIDRNVSDHLSENTRFWVVTPRISATGVSNIGTLISGVYILMDPGAKGASQTKFKGLDESPSIRSDETGTHYVLQAETLGSLNIGSPVYFRQIRVGEVTGYKLAEEQNHVDVNFFVRAPHDQMVLDRSRFWDVSGFGVSIGAEGMKAKMASLTSLIAGGIEFDNTANIGPSALAAEGHRFYLYPDRESVLEERYNIKYHYLLRFSGSVRGLSVGAPVEFRGIKVGEVVNVVLDNADNKEKSLHVYIAMEPQRFDPHVAPNKEDVDARIRAMVDQGLHAQMATSSLITGSKYIDLNFMNDREPGEFNQSTDFAELPTADDAASQLTQKMDGVLNEVAAIPFEDIGNDLAASMASLRSVLETLEERNTAAKIDGAMEGLDGTMANAELTLAETEALIKNLNYLLAPDSETTYELSKALKSIGEASRALNLFLDELNRHPNSFISGAKKND